MVADGRQITAHKAAVARVIRLEDALIEAMATDAAAPSPDGDQVRRLRAALREAYAERDATQAGLFGPEAAP